MFLNLLYYTCMDGNISEKVKDLATEINIPERPHAHESSRLQNKNKNKLIVGVIALAIMLVLFIFFIAGRNLPKDNKTGNNVSPTPETTTSATPTVSNTPAKKIAVSNGSELIITDLNVSSTIEISKKADGDSVQYYSNWRKANVLTYGKCSNQKCELFDYDVQSRSSTKLFDLTDAGNLLFKWDKTGETLFMYYTKSSGAPINSIFSGGKETVVKTWGDLEARGVGLDDNLSIETNPDGDKFLMNITFADSTTDPYIRIFDIKGTEIFSEKGSATDADFIDNSNIIFVRTQGSGDVLTKKIISKNITTQKETVLVEKFEGYSLSLSPDVKSIAYFTLNSGNGAIESYTLNLSTGSSSKLTDDFVPLGWIGNNILGSQTEQSEDFFGFTKLDVSTIGSDAKGFRVLTKLVEPIYLSIEP